MAIERRFFQNVPKIPDDPIFGIKKLIQADKRHGLIDATSGELYRDDGTLYVPSAVIKAHEKIGLGNMGYVTATPESWMSRPAYVRGSSRIVFGRETADKIMDEGRLIAVGTPGGTGGLRLFAEFLKENNPKAKILISNPGYPNHLGIFRKCGFEIKTYPHLKEREYDLDGHVDAIQKSDPNTVVLFHAGRTHNPTGDNPRNADEWKALAEVMGGRFALFDAAYLGWGEGFEQDALGMKVFREAEVQMAVALSNSKNGGMYGLRNGMFIAEEDSAEAANISQRYLNSIGRTIWSNPVSEGQDLMGTIYEDPELWREYLGNQEESRTLFHDRRRSLARALGPDFGFVDKQIGLFSLLLPSAEAVVDLRTAHPYYLLDTEPVIGRINFGSVPEKDMPRLAEGIKEVL